MKMRLSAAVPPRAGAIVGCATCGAPTAGRCDRCGGPVCGMCGVPTYTARWLAVAAAWVLVASGHRCRCCFDLRQTRIAAYGVVQ